jgi:CRISPR/Cas system-associated protein Csm6
MALPGAETAEGRCLGKVVERGLCRTGEAKTKIYMEKLMDGH